MIKRDILVELKEWDGLKGWRLNGLQLKGLKKI